LLVDPTIEPDAVTGHRTGEPLQLGYGTSILNQGPADKPVRRTVGRQL
jgi:hypothetical protein